VETGHFQEGDPVFSGAFFGSHSSYFFSTFFIAAGFSDAVPGGIPTKDKLIYSTDPELKLSSYINPNYIWDRSWIQLGSDMIIRIWDEIVWNDSYYNDKMKDMYVVYL
jgi:hypothetical protein